MSRHQRSPQSSVTCKIAFLRSVGFVAVLSVAVLPQAMAQELPRRCGKLENAYGPYDFRYDKDKLPIVEGAHFNAEVEALVRGLTGSLGGDIDYTLRAFPNHHRALHSMMRLGERLKKDQVPAAKFSVECYYMRAVTFRPDDTIVRQLYAIYMGKDRKAEALEQLDAARRFAGTNAFSRFNIGMVYMDLGEPREALREAHAAMKLGFLRPDLKNRLQAAGVWVEPDQPATPASEAPAASSGS